MQLDNYTDWDAALIPGWGYNRHMQMTCVVKVGYRWNESGELTELSADECALEYSDRYVNDDPETGSILYPNDTVPYKGNVEWLLKGSLVPKPGVAHQALSVRFEDGTSVTEKKIFATGPRYWKKSLLGLIPSKPRPLAACPISYEHAFGGRHVNEREKIVQYDSNPVGTGYYKARDKSANVPVALPTFEMPPFVKSPNNLPTPAGFNAISMTWQPRWEAFKNMDADAAAEGQCPYPADVSLSLYNCAPSDQQLRDMPAPGSRLQLTGFSDNPILLTLPDSLSPVRLLQSSGQRLQKISLRCDTLLIDTDEKTLVFVHRVALPWHPLSGPAIQLQLTDARTIETKPQQPHEETA